MALEYTVHIERLAESDGGGYLAVVPDLPGCMSDGATPEEALRNVQEAIEILDQGRKGMEDGGSEAIAAFGSRGMIFEVVRSFSALFASRILQIGLDTLARER